MKVVLLEDVRGTGKAGDTKEVADGYARNYLIPRKLAAPASRGALQAIEREKATAERRSQKDLTDARALAAQLESTPLVLKVKTGKEGKLFGAVTNADVASALKQQRDINIDRRKIQFPEPVRGLGPATCEIKLNAQVTARVPLMVTSA
jgi:large subunit ribosomal protein L9